MDKLSDRVMALEGPSNRLDVVIEVALFDPFEDWIAIRSNSAGTKVIYTDRRFKDHTYWPEDWTITEEQRAKTATALKARGL